MPRKKAEGTPATGEKKPRALAMTLAPQSERLVRRVARSMGEPIYSLVNELSGTPEVVKAIDEALHRLYNHFKSHDDPFKEEPDGDA